MHKESKAFTVFLLGVTGVGNLACGFMICRELMNRDISKNIQLAGCPDHSKKKRSAVSVVRYAARPCEPAITLPGHNSSPPLPVSPTVSPRLTKFPVQNHPF